MLNQYFFSRLGPAFATNNYPYFEADASRYGGITLELKIQGTLGTQSGTAFDWKRTADAAHVRTWHIAPTVGEQNSYDVLASFLLPQDTYGLDYSDREPLSTTTSEEPSISDGPFLCYKSVHFRPEPVVPNNAYNAIFTQQDLDGLARGTAGEPQYNRIRVNAGVPLAAWLLDIGKTVYSTSLDQNRSQLNEEIVGGQLTYTFTIQTTAALDLKNSISTTLWTNIAGEVSGGWQHTGTMTLVLNGTDSVGISNVKSGNNVRTVSIPYKSTGKTVVQYCPFPEIDAHPGPGYQKGQFCFWPPRPETKFAVAVHRKKIGAEQESGVGKTGEHPVIESLPGNAPTIVPEKREPVETVKRPFNRPFFNRPRSQPEFSPALTPITPSAQ